MPTTVNGVGTHYYGKRDAASRLGTCPHCGAAGKLESYTTRLWFVIIFIPIIPLKRVRILDSCPRCQRHWVANPEQYEMSRQLAVSGALEKHRAQPTVETAMVTHAQYLSFHMHQEADAFRAGALTQFPDNAELLAGFASHLDQTGRWQEGTPLYEQSLAMKPEAPEVRHSMAWRRTNEGKLDEAFELLDYLRQPGSGQSFNLEPLNMLAKAYQKQGNHEKTLELCAVYLREAPAIGEQHAFRKLVAKSEKALSLESSLLPTREFSIRDLFDSKSGTHAPWVRWVAFGSIVMVLFAIGMLGLNEYNRTHRTLYVLSAYAQPVLVSVDGGPAMPVNLRTKISISEGQHQLAISGPVTKQIAVDLRSPYFSRWLSSPIWVVDVEGLSSVFVNTIHYSMNPKPSEEYWLDKDFNFVPHVDYAFEQPPASLKVEGRNTVLTKVHLGTMPLQPTSVLLARIMQPDQSVALTFAEGHLDRNPNDSSLLSVYAFRVKGDANERRVAEFLKSKLWRQPISVAWHRTYQSLKSVGAKHAELLTEYDAQLEKDSNNAALLYLRGRISPTRAEQVKFFRQSYEKDGAQQGWPAMGLAIDAANRGEWAEAKEWCDKAVPALRGDQSFHTFWHTVQMANGDTTELEGMYRQALQGTDLAEMLSAVFRLSDALGAKGKPDDVRREYLTWWNRVSGGKPSSNGRTTYELMIDYVCGDTGAFLKKQPNLEPKELAIYQFQFLIATGQPDVAAKLPDLDTLMDDWTEPLALSVSFALKGSQAEADTWRAKACEELRRDGDSDAVRAAALLERDTAPTDAELDEIVLRTTDTPILLVALAQRFPDRKPELNQRAAKLNVSRQPPYLLVKQAANQP